MTRKKRSYTPAHLEARILTMYFDGTINKPTALELYTYYELVYQAANIGTAESLVDLINWCYHPKRSAPFYKTEGDRISQITLDIAIKNKEKEQVSD